MPDKRIYDPHISQYTQREQERIRVARQMAEEGMVLLENNGALPLKKGAKIALFGAAQIEFLHGGSGSGAVNGNYSAGLTGALERSGFLLEPELLDAYGDFGSAELEKMSKQPPHMRQGTVAEMSISDNIAAKASVYTDIAVFAFSRMAGEGRDRKLIEGDYYLSADERAILATVRARFKRLIVVLNTAGIIDMEWAEQYKPDAVLAVWLPGMEGAGAVADILCGDVCPSGHLMDTVARRYMDIPSSHNFGSFCDGFEFYTGTEDQIDYWGGIGNHDMVPVGQTIVRPSGNRLYTEYQEGLYVGYRYFETYDVPVRYPFGYGLSYTSFSMDSGGLTRSNDVVSFVVTVKNVGSRKGKQVVQIYCKGADGKLEKPERELAAFAKTRLLEPGEAEEIAFSIGMERFESWSEECASWIVQDGEYALYFGDNAHDIRALGSFTIDDCVTLEKQKNHFALTHSRPLYQMSKADKSMPKPPAIRHDTGEKHGRMFHDPIVFEKPDLPEGRHKLSDVKAGRVSMNEFLSQMDNFELIVLLVGSKSGFSPQVDAVNTQGIDNGPPQGNMPPVQQPILEPLSEVVPHASGQTATISRLGIPSIAMSDGPAGVSAKLSGNKIAFPTATLTACAWNTELAEQMGEAMGAECEENHIDVWLAPSMNLHRNPLCGRNYEYFSEDPLLSGQIAASIVKGAQKHRVSCCLKHYAVNNQETSRWDGSDSIVTERVLRELYLKGFEIAVKTAKPRCVMTAYNALNGEYTSTRRDLNTDVLRGEWGFDGFIVTDWEGDGPYAVETLRSGNDLLMPGFDGQIEYLRAKALSGDLSRQTLEECAANLLSFIMDSAAFDRYTNK